MTSKKPAIASVFVRFAECFSVLGLNAGRPTENYGDKNQKKDLLLSLASFCWRDDTNSLALVDNVSNTWTVTKKDEDGKEVVEQVKLKDLAAKEMEQRSTDWTYKKEQAVRSTKEADKVALKAFEALFVENGKLIPIKYIVVTGNRRWSMYLEAMEMRLQLIDPHTITPSDPKGRTYTDISDQIPVQIKDFSDELTRIRQQIAENEDKTQGYLPPSPVDQLVQARRIMRLGGTQQKLRDTFKPGVGDKLYHIIRYDAKYPHLRIIERMLQSPDTDGYIPVSAIRYQDLQTMHQTETEVDLAKYNAKKKGAAEPVKRISDEREVKKYFEGGYKIESKKQALRVKDKNALISARETSKNRSQRLVLEWVTDVDAPATLLQPLQEMEVTDYNLHRLWEEREYPWIEKIIQGIVDTPKGDARDQLFKKLQKVIGFEIGKK